MNPAFKPLLLLFAFVTMAPVTWDTSAGRIIQGDGSRKIVFDTSGFAGKKIVVTAELNDGLQHTATGTCTFEVAPAKKN